MTNTLPFMAALLVDALDDFARSIKGLTSNETEKRFSGFSANRWTVAHIAQHVDSWVIGTMAGKPRDPYLSEDAFSKGGPGEAAKWDTVLVVFSRASATSKAYLNSVKESKLNEKSVYQGSIQGLKGKSLSGNYRLARLIAHIYYNIGEITTIRSAMGHRVDDFPGWLPLTLLQKRGRYEIRFQ